jgi:hypothetical protein
MLRDFRYARSREIANSRDFREGGSKIDNSTSRGKMGWHGGRPSREIFAATFEVKREIPIEADIALWHWGYYR